MKKILALAFILALVLSLFVACGSGGKVQDELTTMMNEASTGLEEFGDDLTENGNVTDNTSTAENDNNTGSTGDEGTDDKSTTGEGLIEDLTTEENSGSDNGSGSGSGSGSAQ